MRMSPILLGAALAASLATALVSTPAMAQFGSLGSLLNRADDAQRKAKSIEKIGNGLAGVSEPEEIKLGGDLAGMILGAAPLVQDQAEQRYVNRLGTWLALHSERPNLPWKFGIIDNGGYNAFSMPGGYVLITRGLFERMRNESELAGVLAHEIGHVVRKHQLQVLNASMRNEALGELKGYFSVPGGALANEFTAKLLAAGKDLYTKGLDKEDEFEADRMGVVIAARAGYSPYGLVGVIQTLSAKQDDADYALENRTHPLPVERLDQLNGAMGTRFDAITNTVDDLPAFEALRTPPPPPPPPPVAPAPAPKPAAKKPARR